MDFAGIMNRIEFVGFMANGDNQDARDILDAEISVYGGYRRNHWVGIIGISIGNPG